MHVSLGLRPPCPLVFARLLATHVAICVLFLRAVRVFAVMVVDWLLLLVGGGGGCTQESLCLGCMHVRIVGSRGCSFSGRRWLVRGPWVGPVCVPVPLGTSMGMLAHIAAAWLIRGGGLGQGLFMEGWAWYCWYCRCSYAGCSGFKGA